MKSYIFNLFTVFWVLGMVQLKAQNISDRIENALPAVVTVTVEKALPIGKVLMGFRGNIVQEAYEKSLQLTDALSSGSGFVIEKNGKRYVITNAHVVESASDEPGSIYVYSYNQTKYEVKVVGGDSFYDVAVLEFVTTPGRELSSLTFAKELPRIASKVYAIGNPLGEYPYTVTDGIVSAVNRSRGGSTGKYGFIQSTATIIWGNSGGPLVNEAGQVVGINSQIAFADAGNGSAYLMQQINFALESVLSQRLVDEIIAKGKVSRAYIGLEFRQKNQIIETKQGAVIGRQLDQLPVLTGLFQGSDASVKLKNYIGWALSAINGVKIRNLEEALGEFENLKPNAKVNLTLTDGRTSKDVSVSTSELKTEHLESLAENVLNQIPDFVVDPNSAQPRLMGKNGYRASYYLLGGGIVSDLWRVTTMADIGALLRVYGLKGGLQYVLVSESDFNQEPQVLSQYFGNRNDELQTMLWY
ncbi:MAG: S1C family serine protease [Moheibacter sp.]